MIKRLAFLILAFVLGVGWLPTAVSRAIEAVSPPTATHEGGDPVPDGVPILTDWYGPNSHSIQNGAGILSYYNLSVFGPDICTAYGDPFSPWNSPWAPGPFTYQFRISIPPDYEQSSGSSIVRVELLDPDSINAPNPTSPVTIPRTNAAIAAGLPVVTTGNCTSNQTNPCLIPTGELPLAQNGTLPLERINPWWFIRMDENRGTGTPGQCGEPTNYDPTRNTQTFYELYYVQQNPDTTLVRQDLAFYTGQVGDGSRDDGGHLTDLQWVSPGAIQSYDYPGNRNSGVPADPGSPGNFEIDLTSETANIQVDPATGERYLYMGITALSGASENGFLIWAGPPTYIETVPGSANEHNLTALNNPGSHSSKGLEVEALENLLLNQNMNDPLDMPLVNLGPEYARANLNISLFDSDVGAAPPITFTVDTMPAADWSLTYAQPGVPDPDGGVRNCVPGSCNNTFITPPYTLTLPTEVGCDYTNPDPQNCTPFYGGTLMARYDGSMNDTYLWQATNLTEPPPNGNPTVGCSAFPIAIHEGIRSVTPPGTGAQPFPNPGDFDPGVNGNVYPIPTYEQFYNHVPDQPLLNAQEGTVYRLWNGIGTGNFGWLRWNEGLNGNTYNLNGSLAWPGNSLDYTDYPDGHPNAPQGQAVPGSGYNWPVWGYIEPGDPTDQAMHVQDWVAANTGIANASYLEETLVGHINNQRVLRLLIWDIADGQGNNVRYHTTRFALFRIVGYNLAGQGWLLFEFIGWDESCGQIQTELTGVEINGPTTGITNTTYSFTAVASPYYAAQPITYTWELAGQLPITHVGGVTDVLTASWPVTGTYTLTVTAVNDVSSPVTNSHQMVIGAFQPDLTIIGPPQLVTPLPLMPNHPVSFIVTVANTGLGNVNSQLFVDLFFDPTVVLTTSIPITERVGYTAVASLAAGETRTITLTAPLGFGDGPFTRTVYAMIDAEQSIVEADEANNISAPLEVDVAWRIYLPVIWRE